jgi:ferredoxin
MTASWGLFLCNCRGALPLDLQKLVLPVAPAILSVASEPGVDIGEFTAAVNREPPDQLLIACCAAPELFSKAFDAAHPQSPKLYFVDLKESCFSVHPDTQQAHAKATRLLRLTMAAAETKETPSYQPLKVGPRILIAGGVLETKTLAAELHESVQPIFVIAPENHATTEVEELPRLYKGRVVEVRGRLGDFHVSIEDFGGPTSGRRDLEADQVVIISRDASTAFKPRTGCHLLTDPSEINFHRLAMRVRELQGEFLKPMQVHYHPEICAGGSAGEEACGICISSCPYDAIGRDPENHLRMRVDHMSCEGCGACVSACPTSALRFTEPSPNELYARMAALLRPLPGGNHDEALILLFHCGEKGRQALQQAGRTNRDYPATILPLEVPCLRFVSEANMLAAFALGAAGVGLLGCERCPHGERELLHQQIDFCRLALDAFALGAERLRLITADDGVEAEAVAALAGFADSLTPTPIQWDDKQMRQWGNREVIGDAIETFIEQLGSEPGRRPLAPSLPFAFADVKASGCTLCRSCVNVCPVHAFKLDEGSQSLQFKHMACVGCGLCEKACPEQVITLEREIFFNRDALEYLTVVKDDMVACAKCGKPYINRRALETIEARVLSLESLLDTFSGNRRNLLKMCPDCRTVAAMLEMEKGWKP